MKLESICLIGGSGFLGQHIAHLLAERGVRVRIPTRRRERVKDELIILPTVDVVEANLHQPSALSGLVEGCDAVISLAGILHERAKGEFFQVHSQLPRKIVDACRVLNIRRIVHVSALKAAHDAPSEYLRSKAGGEQQIHVGEASAIRTTIFRPSVIFGRDDSFLNLFAKLVKFAPVVPLACPNARFQPVFVEDVARAIVESLEKPDTFNNSYELCGPRIYRLQELVEYVCQLGGVSRPIVPLSNSMSYLQAWALEWLPVKLMTRDNYRSMQVDSVCGCDFPPLFGFEPTPLEAVAPSYLSARARKSRLNRLRLRAGR
ncbi:MAG: complex I NDUFA9 subunit family protein [Candidatus Binataceae bacterium]